jgi:hypothetical protein
MGDAITADYSSPSDGYQCVNERRISPLKTRRKVQRRVWVQGSLREAQLLNRAAEVAEREAEERIRRARRRSRIRRREEQRSLKLRGEHNNLKVCSK